MKAVEALALVAGHVDEELLKRNEYLAAENEILRSKIKGRVRLDDTERVRLAKLGQALGRKALEGVAAIVKPETILTWCWGRRRAPPLGRSKCPPLTSALS